MQPPSRLSRRLVTADASAANIGPLTDGGIGGILESAAPLLTGAAVWLVRHR